MTGGLDRAALIDAAAAEEPRWYDHGVTLDWERREVAASVLDAVLPLLADAIEQMLIPFSRDAEKMAYGNGVALDAASLVRSFGEQS